MIFELKALKYNLDELVPYISAETLDYHHNKHHQTYVDNLNKLIIWTEFESLNLEEIIVKSVNWPVFNNAAQVWNHDFYFEQLSGKPKLVPNSNILNLITLKWWSLEHFKEEFNKMALNNFWSGWTWLIYDKNIKELKIENTSNAINFLWDDKIISLLVCDIWEHAYYIDYRNSRAKYLDNFWKILDWEVVWERLEYNSTK